MNINKNTGRGGGGSQAEIYSNEKTETKKKYILNIVWTNKTKLYTMLLYVNT